MAVDTHTALTPTLEGRYYTDPAIQRRRERGPCVNRHPLPPVTAIGPFSKLPRAVFSAAPTSDPHWPG